MYQNNIIGLFNTISVESLQAVRNKCVEVGFNPDRGKIPLEESFNNLEMDRDQILSLIANGHITQFPISVQSNIVSFLTHIQRSITAITSGTDEIPNLVDNVENLHYYLWTINLHGISDQRLAFETKLNELKKVETETKRIEQVLRDALEKDAQVVALIKEANDAKALVVESAAASKTGMEAITLLLSNATDKEKETEKTLSSTMESAKKEENAIKILHGSIAEVGDKITASKESIDKYLAAIPGFQAQVDEVITKANTTITANEAKSKAIIDKNADEVSALITDLDKLKKTIDDLLQKAAAGTLFHTFRDRGIEVEKGKILWLWVSVVFAVLMAVANALLLILTTTFDSYFFARLAVNIPFFVILAFTTLQYSRERKLEEEYAFKSNISLSLNAYRDLVDKLIKGEQNAVAEGAPKEARERLTTFIIEAIDNIFTSPTERVFGDHKKEGSLENLTKTVEDFAKIVKPITDLAKFKR